MTTVRILEFDFLKKDLLPLLYGASSDSCKLLPPRFCFQLVDLVVHFL